MWQFSWVKSRWSMMDHQFLGHPIYWGTNPPGLWRILLGQLSNSQNWCEEMQSGDPTGGSNQAHPPEQSMPFWNIVVSATSGWDMGAQNHRTWVSLTYFEWGNGWIFWGHPFWEHSILPAMIMRWWRWSDLEKQTANDVVLIGGSDWSAYTFVSTFMLSAVQPASMFQGTDSQGIWCARICMPASRWLGIWTTSLMELPN